MWLITFSLVLQWGIPKPLVSLVIYMIIARGFGVYVIDGHAEVKHLSDTATTGF